MHRREVSEGGRMRHRFAFLPLISDPEGREKSRLFHDLDTETEVELAADAPHPPVFACVMRKQGSHSSHKQLECHGFVCNTSEDAIIIAANLYQVNVTFPFSTRDGSGLYLILNLSGTFGNHEETKG